jgi:tetratricopeptide (TPR) repeat protein
MSEAIQEYLPNAETAFTNGQYEAALELCEKAIAGDGTNAEAYTGAGKACLVLDRLQDAESFGAVNADSKEILLKRLQIYVESQDFANAENYAVQLKMLAPAEFRSYQIYFQILAAMGKYDKAEELIKLILKR